MRPSAHHGSSLTVRGQAITGAGNSVLSDWTFNIQRADGSPVGMLVASGWAFGAPPPSFQSLFGGQLAVTGGTGAFFGGRGEGGQSATPTAQRFASVQEDPAIRRDFGGAARTFALRLIPSGRLNLE